MDSDWLPWLIVVVAGLLTAGGVHLLLRKLRWAWLRWSVVGLTLVLAWVPAAVPGYPGQLAPALVVAVFEALFQADGQPGPALRLLAGFTVMWLAVVLLLSVVVQRRRSASATPAEPTPADQRGVAE